MGCDIHAYVEVKRGDNWELADETWLADGRSYGIFGFLADVRNYSHVPPISEARGLPDDVSSAVDCDEYGGNHSHSWLMLRELMEHDYDQVFWDRRVTKQIGPNHWDGAALAEEGEGKHVTLREFLGPWYFNELEKLKAVGDPDTVRVVFWFDN